MSGMDYLNEKKRRKAQEATMSSLRKQANKFDGQIDPQTAAGLLNLSLQKGGMVGTVAQELANEKKTLLQRAMDTGVGKTLAWGIKQLDNVNNTMAATVLSLQGNGLTFGENVAKALKEDTQLSTVVFGESQAETKAGKVVSWLARTSFDTILDPTTYVTFGASGLKKITAGKNLAEELLVKEATQVGLTKQGEKLLGYFDSKASKILNEKQLTQMQEELIQSGLSKETIDVIEKRVAGGEAFDKVVEEIGQGAGNKLAEYLPLAAKRDAPQEIIDKTKKELNELGYSDEMIQKEIDVFFDDNIKLLDQKVLQTDIARKTVSDLMEVAPHLRREFIAKGGINFFGKNILEGVKIAKVMDMIPGMTFLDQSTEQLRLGINSLFSSTVLREGNMYKRIPQELANFNKTVNTLKREAGKEFVDRMQGQFAELGIKTVDEMNDIIGSYYMRKEPADAKMQQAYRVIQGLNGDGLLALNASGGTHGIVNHIPQIITKENAMSNWTEMNSSPTLSSAVTASKKKSRVTFESVGDSMNKFFGDTGTENGLVKTADGGKLRKVSYAEETAKNPELTNKLLTGLNRIIKSLEDEIKFIESIDPANARRTAHHFAKQIEDVKAGNLDNLYIDDSTGEIFFRRGATVDEMTDVDNFIDGFSVAPDEINWLETFTQSGIKRQQQMVQAAFVDDIGKFGTSSAAAPSNYIPLDIPNKSFKDDVGNELVFHPDVAKHLNTVIKEMMKPGSEPNLFLDGYDNLTRIFKSSVTSIFPSFHARNGISNTLNNIMDIGASALDPRKIQTAAAIMSRQGKVERLYDDIANVAIKEGSASPNLVKLQTELFNTLKEPMFTDARGVTWTAGELMSVIKQRGIAFHSGASEMELDAVLRRQDTISSAIDKSNKKGNLRHVNIFEPEDFILSKGGKQVGNAMENHARILNFISNLEKTGDVTHAAARTQMFLYDYSNLTKFEKNVLRRIIPFYSFARRNIALQAELLTGTPGVTLAMTNAQRTFADVMSDNNVTDEELDNLPTWMKRGFYYAKKENGKIRSKMLFESTVDQPQQFLTTSGIFGSFNPIVKVPIERGTGMDIFRGKPIDEVTNATSFKFAPKPLKDFIGYTEVQNTTPDGETYTSYVSLRPSNMHLLVNFPATTRFWSTFGQVSNDNTSVGDKINQFMLGVSTQAVTDDYGTKLEERETREALEKILKDSGVIYQYKRNIVKE